MSVMRELPLAEIFPGERLAADLYLEDGRRLLQAGTVLTGAALGRLALQGVTQLAVQRSPALSEDDGEYEAAVLALLDHRFRRVRGQPLMETLRELVLAYRLERDP